MFQRIGKSYREFVDDWLPVSNAIVEALGLKKEELPHYTTLEKVWIESILCFTGESDVRLSAPRQMQKAGSWN